MEECFDVLVKHVVKLQSRHYYLSSHHIYEVSNSGANLLHNVKSSLAYT